MDERTTRVPMDARAKEIPANHIKPLAAPIADRVNVLTIRNHGARIIANRLADARRAATEAVPTVDAACIHVRRAVVVDPVAENVSGR